jgi:alpha-mannosidase
MARPLNAKADSFIDVGDPSVVLETWKTAEDGNGTILRFIDLGGTQRAITVQSQLLRLKEAWQTDAVERNQAALSLVGEHGFKFIIHKNEIVTIRIVKTEKSEMSGS